MHYLKDLLHINKFDDSNSNYKRIVRKFLKLFLEISSMFAKFLKFGCLLAFLEH